MKESPPTKSQAITSRFHNLTWSSSPTWNRTKRTMKHCYDTESLPTIRSDPPTTHGTHRQNSSSVSIVFPSTWTVGKVSLTFLLLAATGDLIFHQYRGGYSRDDSSPRFKSSLGSAAIGSVTDALSPILPFTGGVDLRREEYRAPSSWETVQSIYTQTILFFHPLL